jgi:hypothetical protein
MRGFWLIGPCGEKDAGPSGVTIRYHDVLAAPPDFPKVADLSDRYHGARHKRTRPQCQDG